MTTLAKQSSKVWLRVIANVVDQKRKWIDDIKEWSKLIQSDGEATRPQRMATALCDSQLIDFPYDSRVK